MNLIDFLFGSKKRPEPEKLEDYDVNNNKCDGGNVTSWRHEMVCTKCMSFVGHDEIMTDICLSCGRKRKYPESFPSVAVRDIYFNGDWREQIKLNDDNYIDKKKIA